MELHHVVSGVSQWPGLFLFLCFFVAVVIYAYWPKNRAAFDRSARSIIDEDDRPCP